MDNAIPSLKKQLHQLQELHDTGALNADHYTQSKAALERRLLDAVLADSAVGTAAPEATSTAQSARPIGRSASKGLYATLISGVLVIAAAGYWWTGSPGQAGLTPAVVATEGASAGKPHATNFDQIAAMTERLAARMQEQADDAEGWAMLARSYSVLGKHADALKAFEKAVALRKDDASLLADYADALAIQNNRSLAGEPMKQVHAALKIDAKNLKALSLAGTDAFNRKDYAQASKYWGQVVQFGPADNPLVQQIGPSLAEARELAGLPATGSSPDTPFAPPAAPGAAATVSGTVTVAAALSKQLQPEDTVFVFARAAEGSRMPLAILRKQVKDLPLQFTLDDSTAMSPANKLSAATRVVVGARISKSGNAMPQAGDLSGQTAVVGLGASGLQLVIKDLVKP